MSRKNALTAQYHRIYTACIDAGIPTDGMYKQQFGMQVISGNEQQQKERIEIQKRCAQISDNTKIVQLCNDWLQVVSGKDYSHINTCNAK